MTSRIERQKYRRNHPTICPVLSWWQRLSTIYSSTYNLSWSHNCTYCGIRLLNSERNGWCCNNGKYYSRLQPLQPLLSTLTNLCNTQDLHFSWLSRRINNLYAFTALGTTGKFINFSGLSNVVVTGRVYHRMLDLSTPKHSLHWFLYDENSRYMVGHEYHIPQTVIQNLSMMFHNINPYIVQLKAATNSVHSTTNPFSVTLDLPSQGGELAAIIHTANLTSVSNRQVVIYNSTTNQPRFISILSNQYEPLQYPLLFPYGDRGWCPEMSTHSQSTYYRIRLLTEPRFRQMGRLTCEYLVDMYSRIEEERLNYIQLGRQQQYRSSPQIESGFQNMLPASFLGSRAWASEQVADALALCREYGKPSLFLTMTTNPQWPEIVEVLQPQQTACEIPEVVCRVFKARLEVLLKLLRTYFGKILYMVRVVELQKRGLPHCHLLLKVIYILNCLYFGKY